MEQDKFICYACKNDKGDYYITHNYGGKLCGDTHFYTRRVNAEIQGPRHGFPHVVKIVMTTVEEMEGNCEGICNTSR